jgi:hypothetical protein
MGGSWLSSFTRQRRVCRQRERTEIDGRRIVVTAQAMIED